MTDAIRWPADVGPSTEWTIYTRGNIGEVYPEVVLPLEATLSWTEAEKGWRSGAAAIGFAVPEDFGDEEYVVMGVFGGYAYFNASLMRLLGVRTPGMGPELIDAQFLGDADVPAYSARKGDRRFSATLTVVRTALRTLKSKEVPLLAEMKRRAENHRNQFPGLDADEAALLAYMDRSYRDEVEFFVASHVINTMQATIAAGALADFCEKHLGDPNLALDLTTGIGDVVSAEPARAMWVVANETAPEDQEAAIASFLEVHGHRGPNEFSMNGRDWASFPDLAIAAIDTMRGLDPSLAPVVQTQAMAERRLEAVAAAKAKLGRRGRKLDKMIDNVAMWSRAREESKDIVVRGGQLGRHAFLELVRRAAERGGNPDRSAVMLLTRDEFATYLEDPASMLGTIEARRIDYEALMALEPPFAFDSSAHQAGFPPISTWARRKVSGDGQEMHLAAGSTLTGAAGAPGTATGRARIVLDPGDAASMQPGDVLVAPHTDPSWTPLFVGAAAVVVEVGAAMSHSMIVSRELGIPCVVGVENATVKIPDGAMLEIDGSAGTIRLA